MAAEIIHLPSSTITTDPEPGLDASEAAQLLMQANRGMLYGLGRRFCGNEDEAVDLVQKTMLGVFRRGHRFPGESKATAWLSRIAARTCHACTARRSQRPASCPQTMCSSNRVDLSGWMRPMDSPRLQTPSRPACTRLARTVRGQARGHGSRRQQRNIRGCVDRPMPSSIRIARLNAGLVSRDRAGRPA